MSSMYNFLFDKRSLVLLLAGMGVAGGVLFFAGVLVGVQWGLPFDDAPTAAPVRPAPKRAAFQPADRPCKPVPEAAPAAPQPAPLPDLFPRSEQKRAASAPAPKPEPTPVEPAPPPPAPVPAPAVAAVAVNRTPDPEPQESPEPVSGPGRYSLQVGAFRDAKNSEKVMQDLQAKGYEPYVVEQRGRSLLRTVRIGRYADRAEALRAASELRRREGLEAIVRPIGS